MKSLTHLIPASGDQDHTTLPYTAARIVLAAAASIASRPTFVTIGRSAPLAGAGYLQLALFLKKRNRNIFQGRAGQVFGRRAVGQINPPEIAALVDIFGSRR
jgi:hypothetical protein